MLREAKRFLEGEGSRARDSGSAPHTHQQRGKGVGYVAMI